MTTLEFRLPIAPHPSFYSNVKLAAMSLAKLGEPYATAPIFVSVGDNADIDQVRSDNAWSRDLPVVWSAIQHADSNVEPQGYLCGLDRFAEPSRADVIIIIDADACLVRPIDELLERLSTAAPTVGGLMAHYSPFGHDPERNDSTWRRFLDAAGLTGHPLDFRYSIATPEQAGHCPAYFNYGFVAFNRAAFGKLRPIVRKHHDFARELLSGGPLFFAGQIGLAFALAAAKIDILELGPEYNCPNSDEMFGRGIERVDDIRVVHYLRKGEFDRHDFLSDSGAFQRFRSASFASAVNRHFQRHVLALPDAFYSARPA